MEPPHCCMDGLVARDTLLSAPGPLLTLLATKTRDLDPSRYFPNSFGRRILGSSTVLAAFATIEVTAPVGGVGKETRPCMRG